MLLNEVFLKLVIAWVQLRLKVTGGKREFFVAVPASAGSLGDQALLQSLQDWLDSQGRSMRLIGVHAMRPIQLRRPVTGQRNFHVRSFASLVSFAISLSRSEAFYVVGADIMDGRYDENHVCLWLDFLDIAARTGLPSRVLGFSFSRQPKPKVLKRFKQIDHRVVYCLRDSESYHRFQEQVGRTALQTADMAFLMQAEASSTQVQAYLDWIRQRQEQGREVVCVNANVLTVTGDRKAFIQFYCDLINGLIESRPKTDMVLLPHDYRDNDSDLKQLQEIYGRLSEIARQRSILVDQELPAWEIKAIAGAVNLVVAGRMHLAIAALSQDIPVIFLTYADKFEGLAKLFGLEQNLVTPDQAYTTEGAVMVAAMVADNLAGQIVKPERLIEGRKVAKALAAENFSTGFEA